MNTRELQWMEIRITENNFYKWSKRTFCNRPLSSAAFSVSIIVILLTWTWCSFQCPHFLLMHQCLCGLGKISLYLLKYGFKKSHEHVREQYAVCGNIPLIIPWWLAVIYTVLPYTHRQFPRLNLGKMKTQRINKKKSMDAVSSHHRVSVHAKQNRINACLSVAGVHVANSRQSNREWAQLFCSGKTGAGRRPSKTVEFGTGLLPLVATCFG